MDSHVTHHLMLIHLGPVQEFIRQARRTRDLWFGSHLLSEISKAAAYAIWKQERDETTLIFPAPENPDKDLKPCDRFLIPIEVEPDSGNRNQTDSTDTNDEKSPFTVVNRLLVKVHTDPQTCALRAREAAYARWKDISERVKKRYEAVIASDALRSAGTKPTPWDEQLETLLEFNAVWLPLPTDQDYTSVRENLEVALASRRNLKDFQKWQSDREDAPRSSLDGARATVLEGKLQKARKIRKQLRIADGEQLDAVGLVKRAGCKPDQFIPIVNVALARWLQNAYERKDSAGQLTHRARFEGLIAACKTLAEAGTFGFEREALINCFRSDLEIPKQVRIDGHLFRRERWEPMFKELTTIDDPGELKKQTQAFKEWCETHVNPVLKGLRQPPRYVACLVADGDRMGKALGTLKDPKLHQKFSAKLAEFAGVARNIVEKEFLGSLVYAGGDDVIAFLPVETAVSCANALRLKFADIMKKALTDMTPSDLPTLSVGIGIGHLMESMGYLLGLGREAEKQAKGDLLAENRQRNALAIITDKRSGDILTWRSQWSLKIQLVDTIEVPPQDRLRRDLDLFETGRLSIGKVYELDRLHQQLPESAASSSDAAALGLLQGEVARILARNEGRGGEGAGARPVSAEEAGSENEDKREAGMAASARPVSAEEAGLQHATCNTYGEAREQLKSDVSRLRIAKLIYDCRSQRHPRPSDSGGTVRMENHQNSTGGVA